jgi:hypothetical protein
MSIAEAVLQRTERSMMALFLCLVSMVLYHILHEQASVPTF